MGPSGSWCRELGTFHGRARLLRNSSSSALVVAIVQYGLGCKQVLGDQSQRLEDGDFLRIAASLDPSQQHFTDLAYQVRVVDHTLLKGNENVPGFSGCLLSTVDKNTAHTDQGAVGFSSVGRMCSDQVDMRSRHQPGTFDHGLRRTRDHTNNIALGGLPCICNWQQCRGGHVLMLLHEFPGFNLRPAPHPHYPNLPHAAHGLQVSGRLNPTANESE